MKNILTWIIVMAVSMLLLAGCYQTSPNTYEIHPLRAWKEHKEKEAEQQALEAAQKEIKTLSISMAEKIANSGKKKIAVVDFLDLQGNITELGRYLAEEFSVGLAGANKGFEVIDRTYLKSILKEHKLSLTGLIDPATVKKFGRISGADAIVIGLTTPLGDIVRVTVKVLDTETARVIIASATNIENTSAINNLLASKIATPVIVERPSSVPGGTVGTTVGTIQRVKSHNFTFELKECILSERRITFKFLVTNNGPETYLTINACGCRIFDGAGNEYRGAGATLSNHSACNPKAFLFHGLPVKAVISKKVKIAPEVTKILLLKFECGFRDPDGNWKGFEIQFRNIPLSRGGS